MHAFLACCVARLLTKGRVRCREQGACAAQTGRHIDKRKRETKTIGSYTAEQRAQQMVDHAAKQVL